MDPFSLGWHLPGLAVIAAALIWLSVIDLRTKTLPRRIIYLAAALGLPWLVVASIVTAQPGSIVTMAIGAAGGLIGCGAVHLLTPNGFGAGDVRLAGLLAAVLGWINPLYAPIGLLLGLVLAAGVGLVLIASGKMTRQESVALGPYLNLGALVTVIVTGLTSVEISFGPL
jgi:leader peptidase (prepilin peptidase) / N-methyltransferase